MNTLITNGLFFFGNQDQQFVKQHVLIDRRERILKIVSCNNLSDQNVEAIEEFGNYERFVNRNNLIVRRLWNTLILT